MAKTGWVSIWRKIEDNPLWLSEKFTKAQAWIDLILLANHERSKFQVRGNWVTVNRGQVARGERTLAERWKWSREKVRRFLKRLESDGQIRPQKSHIISIFTIANYDLYQKNDTTDKTAEHTTDKTDTIINNNENNILPVSMKNINSFSAKEKFEEIWEKYPRKLGKQKSLKSFKNSMKSETDFNNITRALTNFVSHHDKKRTDPQYIPYGSTWFNEQWRDWINYTEEKHDAEKIERSGL